MRTLWRTTWTSPNTCTGGSDNPLHPYVPFFNGVGLFSKRYPSYLHRILRENSDAIGGMDVEPLVPTNVEHLYANRFSHGDKSVILFYNDTPQALEGPLFAAKADKRFFDLINGKELSVEDGFVLMQIDKGGALLEVTPIASVSWSRLVKLVHLHC